MADALTSWQLKAGNTNLVLHQTLHGYAEGHRLLESSFSVPDDLKRVMLRMSDLSGTGVVNGFQEYLTGYPLSSLDAYALAKTWYAPEMPRPGCVWTHTFVIPAPAFAQISSLSTIRGLFKRPSETSIGEYYSNPIVLESSLPALDAESSSNRMAEMQTFLSAHYQREWRALILPAKTSEEFADIIFGAWSQKWPSLRMHFTFCTGSLSARTFEKRLLDVQCVPVASTRQVLRESSEIGPNEPLLVNFQDHDVPTWTALAASDALQVEGSPVRRFLWLASNDGSDRADLASFVRVYEEISQALPASKLISAIAESFPRASDASQLKKLLLGDRRDFTTSQFDSKELLLALATTEHFQSFNPDELQVKKQATFLLNERPTDARSLAGELFRAQLNPVGDAILTGLIEALEPDDALAFVNGQPQFIPALFRINPQLAGSRQMWLAAGDRKRELLESLVAQEVRPDFVSRIVLALLDSGSDGFIRRAFERWGKDAVFAALDWTENHLGSMSETCRQALTFQLPEVMAWVESGPKSTPALTAVAHVVAPYTNQLAKHDSTVWLATFRNLQESGQHEEATYVRTFLLALGLCNAPPAPLDLIAESFEIIHAKAEKQQLKDNAWMILQPLVPELIWWNNWDKCERMRRALLSAFMRHSWPAWELKKRIKNRKILSEILDSVRKVDGEYYFSRLSI
jgi:hypothetical protein